MQNRTTVEPTCHPGKPRGRVLILSPYWVPSVLACIHRNRFLSNNLAKLGWDVHVLAVHPDYYEEPLAPDLLQTVHPAVKIHYVGALQRRHSLGLIGSVALRAFFALCSTAIKLIRRYSVDFLYVSTPPSWSLAIARFVHYRTGIPYGVDFQDPLHVPLGGEPLFSKLRVAKMTGRYLESIGVSRCSFLSGVSEETINPIRRRHSRLRELPYSVQPIGFEPDDLDVTPEDTTLPWPHDTRAWFFAGAIPPSFDSFWNLLFAAVQDLRAEGTFPADIRFVFVGTSGRMQTLAKQYGLEDITIEHPDRISYIRVSYLLTQASVLLALGNKEPHFTPSKIYQLLASQKPILAAYHCASPVVDLLTKTHADRFLTVYTPDSGSASMQQRLRESLLALLADPSVEYNLSPLEDQTAYSIASKTSALIQEALPVDA